jgi:fatty-acyl-CoA synthase
VTGEDREKMGMVFEKPTLDCVLRHIANTYSSKPAIIFEDIYITYSQLYSRSKNLALGFKNMGIGKNDKVAIILPNCLEYMYVYFALFMIGAWALPLSTRYERDELRNVIRDSDAKSIVYKDRIGTFDYRRILHSLKPDLPSLEDYICFGGNGAPDSIPLSDLLLGKPQQERVESDAGEDIDPNDFISHYRAVEYERRGSVFRGAPLRRPGISRNIDRPGGRCHHEMDFEFQS